MLTNGPGRSFLTNNLRSADCLRSGLQLMPSYGIAREKDVETMTARQNLEGKPSAISPSLSPLHISVGAFFSVCLPLVSWSSVSLSGSRTTTGRTAPLPSSRPTRWTPRRQEAGLAATMHTLLPPGVAFARARSRLCVLGWHRSRYVVTDEASPAPDKTRQDHLLCVRILC